MGHFGVTARLTGPTGRSEQVELLVDTGATLVALPRSLADRLEVQTRRFPLLGAVALESLVLLVDPVARRLVPTKGLVV